MNVKDMLCPKSVAIVGASEKSGFGRYTTDNILKGDLGEEVYLVHPKREEVFGHKCYKTLTDIGKPVDLVILCTPMNTVNGLLREAGDIGAKGAVVFASGYSEAGEEGKIAQRELAEIAAEFDMPICGPNCGGFINNEKGVFAFGLRMEERKKKGNIGLISQSGQICSMLATIPYLHFSYLISSGNNAVVGVEDYLEYLVDNDETKVVAVYLEGVKKPKQFVRILAKAAKKRKPIVALKVGLSAKAQQTTTAHTGSLAGSDATFDALFKKYGVIRVDDMEDLMETCLMFSILDKKVSSGQIAICNVSGGEAAISADSCFRQGLELGDYSPETIEVIRSRLPGFASINNPLDMTSALVRDHDNYEAAVGALMKEDGIGLIAMGHNPPEKVAPQDRVIDFGLADRLIGINKTGTKPIVILSGFSRKRDEELREYYASNHIAMLENPKYGLAAIRRYVEFCQYDPSFRTLEDAVPEQGGKGEREILSEHDSKEMLIKYGIPVPKEKVAANEEELKLALKEIGFPVVLKIDSPDIPHKTDIGGVRLNIQTEEEAVTAFHEILANAKKNVPDARIGGVLAAQMLQKGTEMILGIHRDAQFGPMVLVGFGGVSVELFKDSALYPAPFGYDEATEMIKSLKTYPLLGGYRGSRPLDVDALAKMLVSLGNLAVEQKDVISELDMNPVFVYENGVCAVDALIVKG